jgi:hypothetical protein
MKNRSVLAGFVLFVTTVLAGQTGCASGVYQHPSLVSGDESRAELVVLRKDEMWGGAIALLVRLDGEKLAKLRTGRYAEFRIKPDVYRLSMDEPGNLLQVDTAVIDPLPLEAKTRTYVLVSKHSVSWGYSVGACVVGTCPQTQAPAVSGSVTFGFQFIPEEEAQELMGEYERVENE